MQLTDTSQILNIQMLVFLWPWTILTSRASITSLDIIFIECYLLYYTSVSFLYFFREATRIRNFETLKNGEKIIELIAFF